MGCKEVHFWCVEPLSNALEDLSVQCPFWSQSAWRLCLPPHLECLEYAELSMLLPATLGFAQSELMYVTAVVLSILK